MAKVRTGKQPPPDETDDEGDEGEFSDAQIGRITNIVNAAVSGQLQRKLPKAISDGVAGPLGELRTLIEGQGTGGGRRRAAGDDDEEEEGEPPPPKSKKGRQRVDEDPEKAAMKRRLDAIELERKTEREQNRNRERDGLLRESLTKLGVDPNRIRGAVAVLRDSTKYDEKSGEWSFVAKRDGYEDEIDLAQGAKEWASTDEGKSYLAPNSTGARGGSGMRPSNGNTGAGGGGGGGGGNGRPIADPKAAKAQAKQDAVAKLGEAVNQLGGGTVGLG